MMKMTLNWLFNILFGFKKTFNIVLENLALRQQLAAMKQLYQTAATSCQ
jgi:hypothetical protein